MVTINNEIFQTKAEDTQLMLQKLKKDWQQRHSSAIGWKLLAKAAIQQQLDSGENLSQKQDKKGVKPTECPVVVSPEEVGQEKLKEQ